METKYYKFITILVRTICQIFGYLYQLWIYDTGYNYIYLCIITSGIVKPGAIQALASASAGTNN